MGSIVFKQPLKYLKPANNLSVVIIALNEEKNLISLMPEIPAEAEIILVDSHSVDKTVQIANEYGAKVVQRAFDNYSAQKNFAMTLATKGWVLCLDADERPDTKLWNEIIEITNSAPTSPPKIFSLKRNLIFLGKKMRFGRTHDEVKRLFPAKSVAYENEIHETVKHHGEAEIILLNGVLWHESYRSIDDYFAKFNKYTTMMAKTRFEKQRPQPNSLLLALRIPSDFIVRYGFKLGFLDGWQGFLWALFGSFYGFVKYAKLLEMKQSAHLSRHK